MVKISTLSNRDVSHLKTIQRILALPELKLTGKIGNLFFKYWSREIPVDISNGPPKYQTTGIMCSNLENCVAQIIQDAGILKIK